MATTTGTDGRRRRRATVTIVESEVPAVWVSTALSHQATHPTCTCHATRETVLAAPAPALLTDCTVVLDCWACWIWRVPEQ